MALVKKTVSILLAMLLFTVFVGISSSAIEPEELTSTIVKDMDGDVVTVKWDPITNCWRCFKEDGRESIHSGLAPNEYGMWYCSAGRVLFDYSNPVDLYGETWYVKDGKVQTDYTGEVTFFNKSYHVERGKIVSESTSAVTLAQATEPSQISSSEEVNADAIKGAVIFMLLLISFLIWRSIKKRRKARGTHGNSNQTVPVWTDNNAFSQVVDVRSTSQNGEVEEIDYSEQDEKYQKYQYKKKNVLTKHERAFYQKLKPVAEKLGYTVLSKIRMADLVDPSAPEFTSERQGSWAKIRAKHVDFALANPDDLEIALLIELDDSTHQWADRKERDEFVDYVYRNTGYPILHVYNSHNLEKQIREKLKL